MAFWSGPDQETKSVRCALECQKQLALLSEKWKREGLPLVQCRIGINTGNVLLGNFGSSRRFNFTIIGDNVNCASRIESLNKIYGTNIMIGESTYEKLDRDLKRLCRRAERVKVKGKSKELLVYAVQGAHTDPSYDKAFELYVNGNFEKANELFGDLEQDPLVKYKILQCDKYKMGTKVPWNGVVTLQDK
jgi:adenylate cyclase